MQYINIKISKSAKETKEMLKADAAYTYNRMPMYSVFKCPKFKDLGVHSNVYKNTVVLFCEDGMDTKYGGMQLVTSWFVGKLTEKDGKTALRGLIMFSPWFMILLTLTALVILIDAIFGSLYALWGLPILAGLYYFIYRDEKENLKNISHYVYNIATKIDKN